MTAKLIECNINNEYGPSPDVESAPDYKRIEEDKRETKRRKKIAFILNQTIATYQTQQLLQQKLNALKKQLYTLN